MRDNKPLLTLFLAVAATAIGVRADAQVTYASSRDQSGRVSGSWTYHGPGYTITGQRTYYPEQQAQQVHWDGYRWVYSQQTQQQAQQVHWDGYRWVYSQQPQQQQAQQVYWDGYRWVYSQQPQQQAQQVHWDGYRWVYSQQPQQYTYYYTRGMNGQMIRVPGYMRQVSGNTFRDPQTGAIVAVD